MSSQFVSKQYKNRERVTSFAKNIYRQRTDIFDADYLYIRIYTACHNKFIFVTIIPVKHHRTKKFFGFSNQITASLNPYNVNCKTKLFFIITETSCFFNHLVTFFASPYNFILSISHLWAAESRIPQSHYGKINLSRSSVSSLKQMDITM